MNILHILSETTTNGFKITILDFIALISTASGMLTIISKNPIVSVLYLIGLFFAVASYLITSGITFIGLSYLLVYVGAVSILFIFILMLINIRISELSAHTKNFIPLAVLTIIFFINTIYNLLPTNFTFFNLAIFLANPKDCPMCNQSPMFATTSLWDGNLSETAHITSIGNIMYTSYSIWLIISSIILLLAMVGAIVITIKQKN